jgi:hypothetical protein
MIHHSKAFDLYFSDLSWSNALCSVQKNRYRNRMTHHLCIYFARKRHQRTQMLFAIRFNWTIGTVFFRRTKLIDFREA